MIEQSNLEQKLHELDRRIVGLEEVLKELRKLKLPSQIMFIHGELQQCRVERNYVLQVMAEQGKGD
jgi:hypothetical protein